ncbi:substrate-binding domain-containing protein [uncultured Prevotella sp.]|mgnify:CR=1 FL=1|uniref:substrate-binding domain-containing protein n=1 Tax=uncultured Prevotella sp. TaxID=159272 RepID=UPI00262626DF|nr:substrate-binding domain-containing protein [uncultured Prevotella sp.]
MKNSIQACVISLLLSAVLFSCGRREPKFVIGVSQCSEDVWRKKLNDELRIAAFSNNNVELKISSANDDAELQTQQIDSFVKMGVDLLIVAPGQMKVTQAVDRAYDKGIPVIVFDRRTHSDKYTAYIGADNEEMGRNIAHYLSSSVDGAERIVEICGLSTSSPAVDRRSGFDQEVAKHADMDIVEHIEATGRNRRPTGRWTLCCQWRIRNSTRYSPTTTVWQWERGRLQ